MNCRRHRLMGCAALVGLGAALGANADAATDYADVLAAHPVYRTEVHVTPVEHCRIERRPARSRRASATGPILGAIIGGAVGNALGHKKRNKQVGAVLGAALGGSVGYDVSRRRDGDRAVYREQEVCDVVAEETSRERLVGYDVTYRYAGETYSARLREHPGDRIPVRVRVTPLG